MEKMSKLIGEPVRVHTDKDSVPTAFIWRRRVYRVLEVLGWWREPADWWHDKAPRFFVRVTASSASAGTYELCQLGDSWFLQRVLD
jgi:hypothetical protein